MSPSGLLLCLALAGSEPLAVVEYWPDATVYFRIDDRLRMLVQSGPTFIPADGYSDLTAGAYLDVFLFGPLRKAFANDESKERLLSLRFGASYTRSLSAGTRDPTDLLIFLADVQARFHLSDWLLLSFRNRAEAKGDLVGAAKFVFRDRVRAQFEREFNLRSLALTPYVSAEVFWSGGDFSQVRFQGGLVVDVKWFARGQAVELYYLYLLALPEGSADSHVLGLSLHFYF